MYHKIKRQLRAEAKRKTPNHLEAILMEAADHEMQTLTGQKIKRFPFLKRAIAAVLVFVLLFGSLLWLGKPTQDASTSGFGLIIMSAAKDGEEMNQLSVSGKTHVDFPLKAWLQVVDLRHMDAESKAAKIDEAYWSMWHYLHDEKADGRPWGGRSNYTKNVYVGYAFFSDFMLDGMDMDRLSEIQISLAGVGSLEINNESYGERMNQHEQEYRISAEDFNRLYRDRSESGCGMRINWMFSDALFDLLDSNPTLPLSDICDTITFVVLYKDGGTDSFQVQVTFDDAGTMHATYMKD